MALSNFDHTGEDAFRARMEDGRHVGSRERHIEAEVELDRLAFEALAHESGPVELAVEGALERLACDNGQHAAVAETKDDRAYFRRAATSFGNALIEYKAGIRPELLASGAWLLPSRRPGEAPHIVRMDGDWICSCKAQSSMHWSIALIIGIEVAHDDMERFDDPPAEEEDGPVIHLHLYVAPAQLGRRIADARKRLYTEAA